MQEHSIVYKLAGKSLADMHKLIRAGRAPRPDLLAPLGLDSPAVQVQIARDMPPRAYEVYPAIFVSPFNPPDFYMYVPVDYKGRHFIPEGAQKLNAEEADRAANLLFAGGWLGNAPILSGPRRGVALPKDFQAGWSQSQKVKGLCDDDKTLKVFRAYGRSLHIVEDFLKHNEAYGTAVKTLFNEVSGILKKRGYNVGLTFSNAHGSERSLRVSLRRDKDGEPVTMKDNAHFKVGEPSQYGEYNIKPNEKTEEGRAFKKIFEAVPSRPELKRYWQLWNPEAPKDSFEQAPRLKSINGIHFLSYRVDRDKKNEACRPPDARQVNTAAYLWIAADKDDLNLGTEPPPPPRGLMNFIPRNALKPES